MADTRKDKRAPVSLKVRFKSATVDEFIEQYCRDVSRGGIFIKSSQPMAAGTLLKFQLQLKDESSLIKGVGRVVWIRTEDQASADAPAGMGIKFIKMDGDSRTIVDRIIAAHEGAPGGFEEGDPDASSAELPPAEGTGAGFFPDLPPAELPPPEDRTAVRHAAQFLASALSESGTDEAALREAEQKAAEAQQRSAQIDAQRLAEAEQRKRAQASEALPSMIIDPSLGPPVAAPSEEIGIAVSLDDNAPTYTDPRNAPALDGAAGWAESRLPMHSEPPTDKTKVQVPTGEDKAVTLAFAAADDEEAGRKNYTLLYLLIAAVVSVGAFLALRREKAPESVMEEPTVAEPVMEEPTVAEPTVAEPTVAEPAVVEPAASPAQLVGVPVVSSPEGAEIFVGERRYGVAPLTVELPKGAQVTLRARLAGHADAIMEVTPGERQKPVKVALNALPYLLQVDSTPPGATVVVGTKRGTTPAVFTWPGPPKGPLKVTTKLHGYESIVSDVATDSFLESEGGYRSSLTLTMVESRPRTSGARPRPTSPEPESATSPQPTEVVPAATPEPEPPAPPPDPVPPPKPTPKEEPIPDNPFG